MNRRKLEDNLIEELAELTKAILKARKFGLYNWHPTNRPKLLNWLKILTEIRDVQGFLLEYEKFLLRHDKIMDIGGKK